MSATTPPISLVISDEADPALVARYRDYLPGIPEPGASEGLALRLDGEGLSVTDGKQLQLRPDPTTGDTARRLARAGIKREAVARACGLKHGHRPAIVDATAGLGRDGLILAHLGSKVTLVERNPAIAALLADSLRRAAAADWLADTLTRARLINEDAMTYLTALTGYTRPDVVYLDPMFEPHRRRGAVAKETALLAQLARLQGDGDALLEPARRAAGARVVVKRHRHAQPLAAAEPTFRIEGKSTRFDVYLTANGD